MTRLTKFLSQMLKKLYNYRCILLVKFGLWLADKFNTSKYVKCVLQCLDW